MSSGLHALALLTSGWENSSCLNACVEWLISILTLRDRWECTVTLVSVKSCGSLFCGSGALLASFMVQPISLLQKCFLLQWNIYCSCIFIHITCFGSCNMTGYPNTWLTKCALPFFLWYITMWENFLRDSEHISCILIPSSDGFFSSLWKPQFAEQWRSLGVGIAYFKNKHTHIYIHTHRGIWR